MDITISPAVKEGGQRLAGQFQNTGIRTVMKYKFGIIGMHGHDDGSMSRPGYNPPQPGSRPFRVNMDHIRSPGL